MVARRAAVALAVLGACSGKPKPDDAHGAIAADSGSAAAVIAAGSGSGSAVAHPGATTGDLQVRVEWVDVPVVARSSPGRTPCGTPRTPSIAPTTTWGVPDALVIIDGGAAPTAAAHVTLADCSVAPKLTAGALLDISSAVDQPAKLVLRKRGAAADLAHLSDGAPLAILLPIAGHTARAALDPGAVYSLETRDAELSWITSAPGAYVTDASGQLTAHDLAPGKHAVTAWLPPRAGQPARLGQGVATVAAGELAELTVALAPLAP